MGSRAALLAGFGGMAVLLAAAGLYSLYALGSVRTTEQQVYEGFLTRNAALERVRWSIFLSGIYIRDYLVDPDPLSAGRHLQGLLQLRAEIEQALRDTQGAFPAGSEAALRATLGDYWSSLYPVFAWSPRERQLFGMEFLSRRLLPERERLLKIADAVSAINGLQLQTGRAVANERFDSFRQRSGLLLLLTLAVAAGLAVWSARTVLRLEGNVAERYAEVSSARRELEALSARLVEVQEQERRSISRELHDEVGQSLSALLVETGNAAAAAPPEPGELRRRLESIRALGERSVASVRNMALLLRPSMLDDLGLVPALHWQAREVSRRTDIDVDVQAGGIPDELPERLKTCVYRVVQEALNNAARHSGARNVTVECSLSGGRLRLRVADDGGGFDPSRDRGMGLVGIEERVRANGGTLRILAAPGAGATLEVELPCEP